MDEEMRTTEPQKEEEKRIVNYNTNYNTNYTNEKSKKKSGCFYAFIIPLNFSNTKKLCNWAGLTPQNNESAGKKKSTRVSRAGVYLKPTLVQCANAAVKCVNQP